MKPSGSPLFARVAPVGRSERGLRFPAGSARRRSGLLQAAGSSYLAVSALLALAPLALAWVHPRPPRASRYLVVWAMQARHPHAKITLTPGGTAPLGPGRDFLAVYDIGPEAGRFGRRVGMALAGPASFVHHTNYEVPANFELYANDWLGNRSYVFDLHNPSKPRLVRQFRSVGAYGWPHSFQYLPNGDTLATFQFSGGFNHAPGGLVEFAPDGHVVRSASAAVAGFPAIRPYSLAVVPSLDRVVTGSSPMAAGSKVSHVAQIWRLSDLRLLQTLVLPAGGEDAFEPRALADGRTVAVPSADCKLYVVRGLDGGHPSLEHVFTFPYHRCDVPAVAGNFYLQPSMSDHAVMSLDVSDPGHPRAVGSVVLPAGDRPHWVSAEPGGDRVAITGFGDMATQVLFARLDRRTGRLRLAPEKLELGNAIPHAALFSRR